MKNSLNYLILLSAIAFSCADKQVKEDHQLHLQTKPSPKQTKSRLMLNESQLKLANVTIQNVTARLIGETVTVNARLATNQDKAEVISSRSDGRIEKLFIKETGVTTQAGMPLYQLYSETLLTLQQEYLLAKEQFETIGNGEVRYENFLKAAERKLLLYGLTQTQIDALANAKVAKPRVTIVAPEGGVVTDVLVTEGQYVNEGTPLYKLEDLNTLWVEAELYPNESAFVSLGDQVRVQVNGWGVVAGKVSFLSPEYRLNTQIIVMRAVISNLQQQLKPGMQAQVYFSHSTKRAIAVPLDAVIRDGKGMHVYVETDANTFEPRMVQTGLEDVDQVEITDGLKEGEKVVISGAYLMYSETILKNGLDPMAGHNH